MGIVPHRGSRVPATVLVVILAILVLHPIGFASASLTTEQDDLFLSCTEDEVCLLTPTPIGEEIVSDSVFASPAQPELLTFEFDLDPGQDQLALLPSSLAKFEVDFRFTGDATGAARPQLDASLILGQSVTDWEFEAQPIPGQALNEPYVLVDEPLNLNGNRVLWPDDVVRLR
jgi:hypothetical protein